MSDDLSRVVSVTTNMAGDLSDNLDAIPVWTIANNPGAWVCPSVWPLPQFDPATHTLIPNAVAEKLYQLVELVRGLDAPTVTYRGGDWVPCDECGEQTYAEIVCEVDDEPLPGVGEITRLLGDDPDIARWVTQMAAKPHQGGL